MNLFFDLPDEIQDKIRRINILDEIKSNRIFKKNEKIKEDLKLLDKLFPYSKITYNLVDGYWIICLRY